MSNAFAIILHLLAINIWIGGTFFSVMVLPRAMAGIESAEQCHLLQRILRRFFRWVWLAMLLVAGSGGWMLMNIFGNLQGVPSYVIGMVVMAFTMMTIFVLMFFGPYRRFQLAQQQHDLVRCQHYLGQIRWLSKLNMVLGIGVLIIIGTGLFLMA